MVWTDPSAAEPGITKPSAPSRPFRANLNIERHGSPAKHRNDGKDRPVLPEYDRPRLLNGSSAIKVPNHLSVGNLGRLCPWRW